MHTDSEMFAMQSAMHRLNAGLAKVEKGKLIPVALAIVPAIAVPLEDLPRVGMKGFDTSKLMAGVAVLSPNTDLTSTEPFTAVTYGMELRPPTSIKTKEERIAAEALVIAMECFILETKRALFNQ